MNSQIVRHVSQVVVAGVNCGINPTEALQASDEINRQWALVWQILYGGLPKDQRRGVAIQCPSYSG
jgi:hypothetical protein